MKHRSFEVIQPMPVIAITSGTRATCSDRFVMWMRWGFAAWFSLRPGGNGGAYGDPNADGWPL